MDPEQTANYLSVLIGASSVAQLEANVATVTNLDFTRDELAYIDNILI
jgi:aryl-alcohol dehydrogenase-like predicted oxidoreductase